MGVRRRAAERAGRGRSEGGGPAGAGVQPELTGRVRRSQDRGRKSRGM